MNATEFIIQRIPLSDKAIEYAERYCSFYENAAYEICTEMVVISHRVVIDPTESVFWPEG